MSRTKTCPNCGETVAWNTAHDPHAWRHEHDGRWCTSVGRGSPVYPPGATDPAAV